MAYGGLDLSYQGFYQGYTRVIKRYADIHMNPHKSRNAATNMDSVAFSAWMEEVQKAFIRSAS